MSSEPVPANRASSRTIDELWRRALGAELRRMRAARGERLDDTAARAGISPQYLSEVERGRKDPSSEMIAAVVGALQSTLADVLVRVAEGLGTQEARVVDIGSGTNLGRSADRRDVRSLDRFDASLSVAA
jgi:transcriptional regulator with XRE-family HTH domain